MGRAGNLSALAFAVWTVGSATPEPLLAHTRLKPGSTLKVRSTQSNFKTAPCGSTTPTTNSANRTVLAPGQALTVEWEETIQHYGWFRIAFSPDGTTGFDANVLKDNITDTQNGGVTYADAATYHQYSETVTVPTTACETCAIQLIQAMDDDQNPATPPSNYYSCADIRITDDPSAGDDGQVPSDDGAADDEAGAPVDAATAIKPATPTGLTVEAVKIGGGEEASDAPK